MLGVKRKPEPKRKQRRSKKKGKDGSLADPLEASDVGASGSPDVSKIDIPDSDDLQAALVEIGTALGLVASDTGSIGQSVLPMLGSLMSSIPSLIGTEQLLEAEVGDPDQAAKRWSEELYVVLHAQLDTASKLLEGVPAAKGSAEVLAVLATRIFEAYVQTRSVMTP